jgi:indole-3-glycerol phosphate synthase
MEPTRPFQKAITHPSSPPPLGGRKGGGLPRLIAEIKKASPSKGVLREKFDPVEIARIYEGEGAAALSILTEEDFFLGKLSYLMQVRSAVALPILQKDFVVDEFQIYESRAAGADALLLIPSLLTSQQAMDYFHLASDLTLTMLVEVHTAPELEWVLDWATVIGINNRDLKTFKTDIHNTPSLMKGIPNAVRGKKAIVSESGIGSKDDVLFLAEAGVDALLIGEAFMVSESIPMKMKALFGG